MRLPPTRPDGTAPRWSAIEIADISSQKTCESAAGVRRSMIFYMIKASPPFYALLLAPSDAGPPQPGLFEELLDTPAVK